MIVSCEAETQKRSYISPCCRQLYGYEPDEAMRMAATEIIHPDDFPNVRAALNQINGSGQGVVTYRGRRKDGIYIWVEASLTAFRNPRQPPQRLSASSETSATACEQNRLCATQSDKPRLRITRNRNS